jgi:hypothetical protein
MPRTFIGSQTTAQIEKLSVPVPPASMMFWPVVVLPEIVLKRGAKPVNALGEAAALP